MNFVEGLILIAWGALWLTPALALGISIGLRSADTAREAKRAEEWDRIKRPLANKQ